MFYLLHVVVLQFERRVSCEFLLYVFVFSFCKEAHNSHVFMHLCKGLFFATRVFKYVKF